MGSPETHTLPNKADDEFDPYQYRLYGHYARVCNEAEDGACHEGTRELAVACRMSTGKVVDARRQLVEQGYITLKSGAGDQPFSTALTDKCSPHEHLSVQDMNESVQTADTVHSMNGAVHQMNDTVHEVESVHHMNTKDENSRAITDSTESLKHLNTQDKSFKDKSIVAEVVGAPAREESFDGKNPYALYVANIGELTPHIEDKLKTAVKASSAEWVSEAIGIAVEQNVRKWSYIASILDSWNKDGKNNSRPALVKGAPARAAPKPKSITQSVAASTSIGAPNLRSNRG